MPTQPTFTDLLAAFAAAVASGNEADAKLAGEQIAEHVELLRLENVRLHERLFDCERQRYAGVRRARWRW